MTSLQGRLIRLTYEYKCKVLYLSSDRFDAGEDLIKLNTHLMVRAGTDIEEWKKLIKSLEAGVAPYDGETGLALPTVVAMRKILVDIYAVWNAPSTPKVKDSEEEVVKICRHLIIHKMN